MTTSIYKLCLSKERWSSPEHQCGRVLIEVHGSAKAKNGCEKRRPDGVRGARFWAPGRGFEVDDRPEVAWAWPEQVGELGIGASAPLHARDRR